MGEVDLVGHGSGPGDDGLGRRAGGAEKCREGSGYQSFVEADLAGFGARLY